MFTFRIKKETTEVKQLLINNKFVKYIKNTEVPALAQDINAFYLEKQSGSLVVHDDDREYTAFLDKGSERALIQLLTCGKGKKAIHLPTEVEHSVEGQLVSYSYRELNGFRQYWCSPSQELRFSLYEQLSQDLIEVPYVDDPKDYVYLRGHAWHTNHGTGLAIRQVEHAKNYLAQIKRSGNPVYKTAANALSEEESACLELAAYLFRSGRTNEIGWKDDPTYGKRSAAIFKQVALELAFNPQLVDFIADNCFDYDVPLVFANTPGAEVEETHLKIDLLRTILKISHDSDLVRLTSNHDKIKQRIATELALVLANAAEAELVADHFLTHAVNLCVRTGSAVAGDKSRPYCTEIPWLAVRVANQPKKTLYDLMGIKPQSLPQLVPPTQAWIDSTEHGNPDPNSFLVVPWDKDDEQFALDEVNDSWEESDIAKMPTKACITEEERFLQTHVTVYHATTKASYALDMFCRHLEQLLGESTQTAWIRAIHSKPAGELISSIDRIKEIMAEPLSASNRDRMAWHLLSCNPSLWQNSDCDSQESSIDYYSGSLLALPPNFKAILTNLLDAVGLLVGESQRRKDLVDAFSELTSDISYGMQGVLYQYIIPHELVDKLAYISGKNGLVDEANPSALDTLMQLKTAGGKPANAHTLQVRLLVPHLLNPTHAAQIIVNNHLNMTTKLREGFEGRIKALANAAYEGPTLGVVEKPKVDMANNNSYVFDTYASHTLDLSAWAATNKSTQVFNTVNPLFDDLEAENYGVDDGYNTEQANDIFTTHPLSTGFWGFDEEEANPVTQGVSGCSLLTTESVLDGENDEPANQEETSAIPSALSCTSLLAIKPVLHGENDVLTDREETSAMMREANCISLLATEPVLNADLAMKLAQIKTHILATQWRVGDYLFFQGGVMYGDKRVPHRVYDILKIIDQLAKPLSSEQAYQAIVAKAKEAIEEPRHGRAGSTTVFYQDIYNNKVLNADYPYKVLAPVHDRELSL